MNSTFRNIADHIICGKHSNKYLIIFYIIFCGSMYFSVSRGKDFKSYLKDEHQKLQLIDERLKILEEIIYKNQK